MKLQRILVVDDESAVRSVTADILRELGYQALAVSTADQARQMMEGDSFDLVLCDINLGGDSGMEFLSQVRRDHPGLPLMIMTGFGTLDSAVEAIRLGVFEYFLKPIDPANLRSGLTRLEDSLTLRAENSYLRAETAPGDASSYFWGDSPAMRSVFETISKIARSDATVLIRGESGTGKEVVARTLHQKGRRAAAPFIRVNCAAIPASLLESEFFGHEKGAFTGATQRRQGRFELADQGTLLLDEISEIPPDLQVKLLRVLQEREFERVGGNTTIKVDVNIIATTNRHLENDVRDKRFREDLFYRLNVVPIILPPLRERGDDVCGLAEFFLKQFARKHGKPLHPIPREVLLRLKAYPWPGNVRELQNAIERAVILCEPDGILRPEDFPDTAHLGPSPQQGPSGPDESAPRPVVTLAEMERQAIHHALQRCGGNRTQACALLGITTRTLRNKLALYRQEDSPPSSSDSHHG